jgi:hypothetical protein
VRKHKYTVGLFKPKPLSIIMGFVGYLNGCIAEYEEVEKMLAMGHGYSVICVKTIDQQKTKANTV